MHFGGCGLTTSRYGYTHYSMTTNKKWFLLMQPNKRFQALLFDQIAQDFVSIFLQMDDNHKDAIFMVRIILMIITRSPIVSMKRLPVLLAQALYSTFCQAFPGSNQELNTPDFLDYISNTTSEWMIGEAKLKVT